MPRTLSLDILGNKDKDAWSCSKGVPMLVNNYNHSCHLLSDYLPETEISHFTCFTLFNYHNLIILILR